MVTRARNVFSVEEANRSLPLVSSIVSDVATLWHDLVKARERFGNSSPEHDHLLRELAENIQELHVIGCHLRDFETGAVDFPTLVDGHEQALTWRLGEDHVSAVTSAPAEPANLDTAGLDASDEAATE